MHGMVIVCLLAAILLGARDMVFPFLNMLSYHT